MIFLYSFMSRLYTGWFMKNVIPSGNWFVMSCWWKKFIWIWVRFSIVSEKTICVFRNGMKPCEPRSVALHSEWGKRAVLSWYWGNPLSNLQYRGLACGFVFRVARLGDKLSSRLILTLGDLRSFGLLLEILTSEFWVNNKLCRLLSLLLLSQRFINCYTSYIRYGSWIHIFSLQTVQL